MSVAFFGLGNMGGPMALNLVRNDIGVRGFDPVAAAADSARASGVEVLDDQRAVLQDADVVISMLPSGRHVLDLYTQVLESVGPNTLFLDCSTIDVAAAREAADMVIGAGHHAVDAPVSGGVVGAEAATLTFMAGGAAPDVTAAKRYLDLMGARTIHCGQSGAGQAAKICNNLILGISMIGVSEAFALGEKLGLDNQALFDVSSTASGQCWSLTTNCPVPGPVPTSPANRDYSGGFASGLMLKDLRLAGAAAADNDVATLLGDRARELYETFVAVDGPGRDFSAIITAVRDGQLDTSALSRSGSEKE